MCSHLAYSASRAAWVSRTQVSPSVLMAKCCGGWSIPVISATAPMDLDVAEVCVVEDGLHPGVGVVVGVDALSGLDVVEEFCHVAGGLDERDFDAKWLAF